MKVVILGCGRVGARLAQLLEADGHQISIIDSELASFDRLPETFKGQTVLGTGIDADVLKAAGIEDADSFAAVTNYDNTNIMACQVAKEIFGVPHVLARIYDPGRESLYHELGLETICPTTLVSTTARDILLSLAEQPAAETLPIAQQLNESRIAVPVSTVNATANNGGATTIQVSQPIQPIRRVDEKTATNGKRLRGLFNRNS